MLSDQAKNYSVKLLIMFNLFMSLLYTVFIVSVTQVFSIYFTFLSFFPFIWGITLISTVLTSGTVCYIVLTRSSIAQCSYTTCHWSSFFVSYSRESCTMFLSIRRTLAVSRRTLEVTRETLAQTRRTLEITRRTLVVSRVLRSSANVARTSKIYYEYEYECSADAVRLSTNN